MKITELRRVEIGVERVGVNGGNDHFRLSFTDKASGDVIWIAIPPDVAEQIAEKLTRGVHIARVLPSQ